MVMFVLGMLTWQAVTTVVYFAFQDDDKACLLGCGVFIVIIGAIGNIIYKIRLHNSRKYNLYQFFGNDGKNTWIGNYYMTEQNAERFNLIDRNAHPTPYSVRLYRAGYEYRCIPPKNEILTAKMIENGTDGFTKDFFEKFYKKD